jgi:hypothetical protein
MAPAAWCVRAPSPRPTFSEVVASLRGLEALSPWS